MYVSQTMEAEDKPRHRSSKRKKDKKHRSKSKSKKRKRSRSSSSPDNALPPPLQIDFDRDYSHKESVDIVKHSLDRLFAADALLNDLPSFVTLEEVNSLVALEHGRAMNINIEKEDGSSLPVIIEQTATVGDLKKAVERATTLKLVREQQQQQQQQHLPRISWKYIWKTYWLFAHGQKLKKDQQIVKEYSIENNDSVSFIKRLKDK